MSFLKVGEKVKPKQRLYIMEIVLPSGMPVVKIGKASGPSSKERMLQICSSIYDMFRTTPSMKIKRDREVPEDKVFKYETILHRFFKDYRYETKHKWSGNTECFVVPIADVVQAYEAVIAGNEPDFVYALPLIDPDDPWQLPF